jgi:hypothetical protein
MNRFAKCLTVLSMAAIVSAVSAADSPAGQAVPAKVAPAKTVPAADPDRIVCKRIQALGTLFAKKLCKSARDWQIEEELAKDTMKRTKVENSPGAQ